MESEIKGDLKEVIEQSLRETENSNYYIIIGKRSIEDSDYEIIARLNQSEMLNPELLKEYEFIERVHSWRVEDYVEIEEIKENSYEFLREKFTEIELDAEQKDEESELDEISFQNIKEKIEEEMKVVRRDNIQPVWNNISKQVDDLNDIKENVIEDLSHSEFERIYDEEQEQIKKELEGKK